MSIKIEIFTDHKDVPWKLVNNLFATENVPKAFLEEELLLWWNYYGTINHSKVGINKTPYFVCIFKNDIFSGFLPLMTLERKKKWFTFTILQFFSQSFCGENLDILQNDLSLSDLLETFKHISKKIKYDFIDLGYLSESSILIKLFSKNTYLHSGHISIPINQKYEDIRSTIYSKNLRHVLNKFERRIKESNEEIHYQCITDRKKIHEIKEEIIEVSLSKLNEASKHSIYNVQSLKDSYFDSITNEKFPYCLVYRKQGSILSYNMGYIWEDTVMAIDAAYNRDYGNSQKIGLGILAYDKLVNEFAGKYKYLDMGFGFDDYKFRFSKNLILTRTIFLPGNTIKSKVFYNNFKKLYFKIHLYVSSIINKYEKDN